MKKLIFLIMILFPFLTHANCENYKDIDKNSQENNYINFELNKDIMAGYTNCTFRPNNNVKYIEFLGIMYKLLGIKIDNKNGWQKGIISNLNLIFDNNTKKNPLITKIENNSKQLISNEEAVYLITKLIEYNEFGEIEPEKKFYKEFLFDDIKTNSLYYDYVQLFKTSKILSKKDGDFVPESYITRIDLLKMIINAYYTYNDKLIYEINDIKTNVSENKESEEKIFTKNDFKKIEKNYLLINYKKEFRKDFIDLIFNNYDNLKDILMAYDYINKTNKTQEMFDLKNTLLDKLIVLKENGEIFSYLKEIKKENKNTKITGIKGFLPKEIEGNEYFAFMIKGIYKNNMRNAVNNIAKKLGLEDGDIVIACILAEQTRYFFTNRGYVKKYLKYTPFLFSLSDISYGIGGIKEFTGEKIEKDAKTYGYYEKVLKSSAVKMKDRLQDKNLELIYPTLLVKNILTRRKIAGFPIDNKPGIIGTLYNFGNPDKKIPNKDPKIGGGQIKIGENVYSFGGITNTLYWYLKTI